MKCTLTFKIGIDIQYIESGEECQRELFSFTSTKKGEKKSSRSLKVITAVCAEVINKVINLLCSSASSVRN